ncbi:hypothetical protein BD560DRAFT_440588 [Blakeslea trispora]|nr:hypothetical protein BD560DRAFT_440588 [Blakeslea trispora]
MSVPSSDADVDTNEQNRDVRVSLSGKLIPTPHLKRANVYKTDYKARPLPTFESQPYISSSLETERSSSRRKQVQVAPNHQLYPTSQVSEDSQLVKTKIEQIVIKIINEFKHTLSITEIAVLSPGARTCIKGSLTKPQTNKKSIDKDPITNGTIALLSETITDAPKGKSAPHAKGWIDKEPCTVILDGGCTPFIISLSFAKKLGVRKLEPVNTFVMFGDDNNYAPVELVKNLRLQVGNSQVISIDALCFDVERFKFIVGREGLHALKIGTDWSTHFWYTKRDDGTT